MKKLTTERLEFTVYYLGKALRLLGYINFSEEPNDKFTKKLVNLYLEASKELENREPFI